MLTFDKRNGRLSAAQAGLTNGLIIFRCRDFSISSDRLTWRKIDGQGHAADHADCRMYLNTTGSVLTVGLENRGARPVELEQIEIRFQPDDLAKPMMADDYLEFIQRNFGGGGGVKQVGLSNRWIDHNPESRMVYLLKCRPTGACLLLGALPGHQGDYTTFRALHATPHLQDRFGVLICSHQRRAIAAGARADITPVRISIGRDPLALLEEHGELFRRARPGKLKPVATGWNSWDYFTGAVAAGDMFDNMRAARRHFGKKIRYAVIDEGWEPRWGDWVANWKFPDGLRDFCRKTRAMGMLPGIWTAPALVNRYTRLYRDHPEWFARKADGQVAVESLSYGPMSLLDITHPEARQWVYDTYRRLRREGFRYFKVDFTQRVLQADLFHDRGAGRGMIIRMIFETVRRAIGDDAYLLACGPPFQSVTGLADAVRVSDDIHNYWCHLLANVNDIAGAWWLHRRAWNNDPDFAIARSRETAVSRHLNSVRPATPFNYRPAWMNGREMNAAEIRCYLLLLHLSAGELFLGDDLPGLKPAGIALLRRIMRRPLSQAARPLDLFDNHAGLPSIYLARERNHAVLGLFNWEEDPAEMNLSLRACGLDGLQAPCDFWTGAPVRINRGHIKVSLAPRRSLGLTFTG